MFCATLVTIALLLPGAYGFPSGAALSACDDSNMTPGHNNTSPRTDPSPFNVIVDASTYDAGQSLTVTLMGNQNFSGFLVMALPSDNDTASAVGMFEFEDDDDDDDSDNDDAMYYQSRCEGGATHKSAFNEKGSDMVELTWMAPEELAGNLTFYATFAVDRANYWVKVPGTTVLPGNPLPTTTIKIKDHTVDDNAGTRNHGALLAICGIAAWMISMTVY